MTEVRFQPFDPLVPVTIYRRALPHWRQKGCTYFVTFRLADSIPRAVATEWMETRRAWLKAHGIDRPLREPAAMDLYLRIPERDRRVFEQREARRYHAELDRCHGACILAHPEVREGLAGALQHFHGGRCASGDWVVMPNHVHWLVQPLDDWDLEDLLQSIKRYSATMASKAGWHRGTMWQKESYDRIVRDSRELLACREYIERNPVKAGLPPDRFSFHRAEWLD